MPYWALGFTLSILEVPAGASSTPGPLRLQRSRRASTGGRTLGARGPGPPRGLGGRAGDLWEYVHAYIYIYSYPPPQRSTKINAIRDILGYFHPHSSDHDDSDRWWTCEDMYISWFHSDVSDGSVKQ